MDDRIGVEILAELKKLNKLFDMNIERMSELVEKEPKTIPTQFKPKRETRGRKAKDKSNIAAKPRAYVRKKIQP